MGGFYVRRYFFRDTVFLMVIFTAVFKKRILQNNCILYAVTTTVSGIAWRQIYFFLLKLLTDRGSIRRPDDVFPLQEGTPNIRPLMLLIFAVFMGCLLTKATLSHLVILAVIQLLLAYKGETPWWMAIIITIFAILFPIVFWASD